MAQTAEITTLVVPVPEADGAVDGWRTKHDWSARAGVPSHITLLGPFLPPDTIDPHVLERLRSLFGAWLPVRFRLTTVERLPGLVYLAPEPDGEFRRLTETLQEQWPEAPRFGEAFERPLHHLTVARDGRVYDEIKGELGNRLPIEAIAREVLLFEKRSDGVRRIERFPLGA